LTSEFAYRRRCCRGEGSGVCSVRGRGDATQPSDPHLFGQTGGISVEDCAEASRAIEAVFDSEDLIPTKYVLEVSSPGLERELYRLADFERFLGKLVKLKTRSEINGTKSHVGRIESVEGTDIRLKDRKGTDFLVPFDQIERANLKIDLDSEFRR
jgi:ribosome maturation factor RimP